MPAVRVSRNSPSNSPPFLLPVIVSCLVLMPAASDHGVLWICYKPPLNAVFSLPALGSAVFSAVCDCEYRFAQLSSPHTKVFEVHAFHVRLSRTLPWPYGVGALTCLRLSPRLQRLTSYQVILSQQSREDLGSLTRKRDDNHVRTSRETRPSQPLSWYTNSGRERAMHSVRRRAGTGPARASKVRVQSHMSLPSRYY